MNAVMILMSTQHSTQCVLVACGQPAKSEGKGKQGNKGNPKKEKSCFAIRIENLNWKRLR
jgi:hypothetical protein